MWKRYIDTEKSGRMAHHGNTEEEKGDEKEGYNDRDDRGSPDRGARKKAEQFVNGGGMDQSDLRPPGTGSNEPHYPDTGALNTDALRQRAGGLNGLPRNSSDTRVGSADNGRTNDVSGVSVDPEKGRDVSIVTWYGNNDPEVKPYLQVTKIY